VDTRSKILTLAAAERLPGCVTLATGYFDVLRVEPARALAEARRPLLVAVVRHAGEILDAAARAEMAAALRVVDYVVTIEHDDLDALTERLRPAAVLRLEASDQIGTRRLTDDVRRSQTR